jgi:uncharacterized protein (UPF0548 family)
MDILFPPWCTPCLPAWERRPIAAAVADGPKMNDCQDRYERIVGVESPGPPMSTGPHRQLAAAILAYDIFPSSLVRGILRRNPVQVGDTVGIRFAAFGIVHLFFAARVSDVFDGPSGDLWRTGFTYRSLAGHPELGEETFAVEKDLMTGKIRVVLSSWSRPGTRLAHIFAAVVRWCQVRGSRAALRHLSGVARKSGIQRPPVALHQVKPSLTAYLA